MRSIRLFLCLASALAVYGFHEQFGSDWETRWQHSADPKYAGKFVLESSQGSDDKGLKVPDKALHYGISSLLPAAADPADGLVIQFDVKHGEWTCGGAYLKYVTADDSFNPAGLKDDTPYTIMFGPDKCGATNKVHLIVRHKSPKTGEIEEKHLKNPPSVPTGELTHVYTAILNPTTNTYAVLVDGEEKKAGSLFTDFEPAFNPPEEIDDPNDSKPEDWVDVASIPDPTAEKPEDWDEDAPEFIPDEDAVKPEGWLDDEPLEIADPDATKPEDWDDDEDGDWEAPMIANPKCKEGPGCGEWKRPTKRNPDYKGKWTAPMVDNPEYKGPWAPRKIPNPDYYKDDNPLQNIGKVGAVAIEIWTMDDGIFFDNIVVTSSADEAAAIRETTWESKHAIEKLQQEEEAAKKKAEEEKTTASEGQKHVQWEQAQKIISLIFDQPFLEPYAEKLAPIRAAVEANPLLLGSPLLLLLPLLLSLVGRKKKVDVVGKAKKEDITPADDKPIKKNGVADKSDGEIEEDDDEEEEEKPTAARRRARRD